MTIGSYMPEAEAQSMEQKTPNEELATLIVAQLVEAGLLPQGKKSEVLTKVANGSARQDDWQVWIEMAIDQKAKEAANGQA